MTKLKVELELNWFDSETGSVSDEIKNEVVRGLQDRLISKVEKQVQSTIESKIEEAADKVTDEFLVTVYQERLQNLKIPVKSSSWGSEVKYQSISEFVGKQFDDFLQRKVLNERGERVTYERDAKYTIFEYFARDILGNELESKVSTLISEARQKAEGTVLNTLEKNLREQLSADIISRLNIPSMLKSLQEKAAEIELNGD
ncbi:hypothetical protein EJP82_01085 [Paenibacillus anaericanus]|uniref:Uncharacterized protein n=1 Tax=Paenibacillus anaericanus TaxID=170367 RepID=A0A3S1EM70_9BACL|nr:hypothetical protein [Paenibacillus anaericanus]RUT48567.1 hypothetical protein EJP82_01085 [Paenibacillus anaericanus]